MILAPISISNFKAHNKSHIDRVFNYFALICNTNCRAKRTHTHHHSAAEERRTPITCAQLCDIIYSNFSNRSIKLGRISCLSLLSSCCTCTSLEILCMLAFFGCMLALFFMEYNVRCMCFNFRTIFLEHYHFFHIRIEWHCI